MFNTYKYVDFPSKMEESLSIGFSHSAREDASQTDPITLNFDFSHSCRHLLSSVLFREHVHTIAIIILSYFQKEMMIQEDPIELEKMMTWYRRSKSRWI